MEISLFFQKIIEASGCDLIDGLPKLPCREQTCGQCKLSEVLSLKNFERTLNLPFRMDLKTPTHTFKTKNNICNFERVEQKDQTYTYKHTVMETVEFKEAWAMLFEEHSGMKNGVPFATSFLNYRAQVDWFDQEFSRLIDQGEPCPSIRDADHHERL